MAKGFETVVIRTKRGNVRTGIVKEQNQDVIRLITAEGKLLTVRQSDVEGRDGGKSAMPEDAIQQLSRSELRDLVEFLSTLKKKLSDCGLRQSRSANSDHAVVCAPQLRV